MSEHQEGSPTDPSGVAPRSPFARPPGFEGSIGYGPPAQQSTPEPPEPRFAGAPHYGSARAPIADAPTAELPFFEAPSGEPAEPWQQPVSAWPPSPPARNRKSWVIVAAVLVVALIAGGTTVGLLSSHSSSSNPSTADPNLPVPLASPTPGASAGPAPNSSATPSSPLPNVGLPTPPALLAIGYHVYSSGLREPADVAIDAAEEVQFKKDGLERIVGLQALTIGVPGDTSDDYDADISVLRFTTAAGAKTELDYSNMRNKESGGSPLIALPGLPQVTAFLNKDATGYSVGAFASVGRYQVVLILGGLSPNVPADSKVIAAEAARVMKALLPAAATIEPDESGSSPDPTSPSPVPSEAPTQAPTEAPSQDPFGEPSATPSGIHA